MTSERAREEALQEYYFVEQMIDNFDARALQIKSWSVTTSGVALGVGFLESQPTIFLLAAASSLAFWYTEATWKSFQHIFADRASQLEEILSKETVDYSGPQIGRHFSRSLTWKARLQRFPQVFFYDNTFLPHAIVVVVGVALYFLGGSSQ